MTAPLWTYRELFEKVSVGRILGSRGSNLVRGGYSSTARSRAPKRPPPTVPEWGGGSRRQRAEPAVESSQSNVPRTKAGDPAPSPPASSLNTLDKDDAEFCDR